VGVAMEIVKKSGAWFTYEGEQLGQGRENARQFLQEHKDIAGEIEGKIRETAGLSSFEGGDEVVELEEASAEAPAAAKHAEKEPTRAG
jgi:recombination protein RecA